MNEVARTESNGDLSNRLSQSMRDRLLAQTSLTEETLGLAVEECQKNSHPIFDYLLEQNIIQSLQLAEWLAIEYSLPFYDISQQKIESIPLNTIKPELAMKHQVLPITHHGSRLLIATADPNNADALREIRFQTGSVIKLIVVDVFMLRALLQQLFQSVATPLEQSLQTTEDFSDIVIEQPDDEDEDDIDESAEEAPIVKFINKILIDSINSGVSDIHFEPYETYYRIRGRIDGLLTEIKRPPSQIGGRLAARLKVMSRMDISERRKPQDGRFKLRLSKAKSIDFRVNTLPTIYGEKIVLRILDASAATLGIDALGYEPIQQQLYKKALAKPQGMILITGPTGSGKTVSLYTGLNVLNTETRNISTAEDPVEINLDGVNQVHVNPKIGLTFAEALRSFLRQDPDIIMVGEIRDLETAEISIKASQTGHLVLSTLHTNSASEALTRLLNMGVPSYNVASSCSLIIAQRLARRLCPNCKEPVELPEKVLQEEGLLDLDFAESDFKIMDAQGCNTCNNLGLQGRTGVYEVVKITKEISQLIMQGGNSLEIAELAEKQGFNSLRTSALRKVAMGEISLSEANRVTIN